MSYSFSGHESFPFRYPWPAKGVRGVAEIPDLFGREDAPVRLGVGKNMVRSIRHWCTTLELICPEGRTGRYTPTRLGVALFADGGWDPYLEDIGTLWLLHWQLVREPERASTWYLAFTRWGSVYFTRKQLVEWLLRTCPEGSRATPRSIERDVQVFVRSYVAQQPSRSLPPEDSFDCPLAELGLIEEMEHGSYRFVRGRQDSLPREIFTYALIEYWRRTAPDQKTLSFEAAFSKPGSPGGTFKLSENAFAEYLENLPSSTGLAYDQTAGMRVLYRLDTRGGRETWEDPMKLLEAYYAGARW